MHAFVCSPFSRKITVPYLHFGNVSICNCAACMSSSNWRRASDSQKMKILLSSPRTVASCNFEPYFPLGVVCSPRCKSPTHRFKGTREHAISSQALAQVTSAIQLCNRKYGREIPRAIPLCFFNFSSSPATQRERLVFSSSWDLSRAGTWPRRVTGTVAKQEEGWSFR